jgi:3-dehydroquinate synthase class II
VLTTIFPPGPVPLERRLTWDSETLALIEATNRAIREAADGRRVVVLDAYSLLRDDQGLLAPQYADGDFFLHVNRAAYARLNSDLSSLLTVQRYSK